MTEEEELKPFAPLGCMARGLIVISRIPSVTIFGDNPQSHVDVDFKPALVVTNFLFEKQKFASSFLFHQDSLCNPYLSKKPFF